MRPLEKKISDVIEAGGPITFERFMDMALYEPGLGYYTSPTTEIGRQGDYYTSPHLHPIFGAMIGRQVEEFHRLMGSPDALHVIEMGAGRGYLAKDMLDYLERKAVYKNISYHIVEINPAMAYRQKELLTAHAEKISWDFIGGLTNVLNGLAGCVISNELLDAFPVHMVQMEDELKEIYVSYEAGRFVETTGPLSTHLIEDYFKEAGVALPKGYRTEVNLRVRGWLGDVSRILKEGFVLTVDYGYPASEYYSEERSRGTLMCYKSHVASEDPYEDVGKKDITSHVDFSALKKWGEGLGLRTAGFCPQGQYLVSLGIDEVISELYEGSPEYLFEVAKIKGLIFPGTMGESHKVMAQYKGPEKGANKPLLRGFTLRNQAKYL